MVGVEKSPTTDLKWGTIFQLLCVSLMNFFIFIELDKFIVMSSICIQVYSIYRVYMIYIALKSTFFIVIIFNFKFI